MTAMILKDFRDRSIMHGYFCAGNGYFKKSTDSAVNGIYSAEQIHTLPVCGETALQPLPDGMYQVKKESRQQVVFRTV